MPAYIPLDFLDNTGEHTLAGALVRLIAEWDQAELDAATGFFEPHVWRYLEEAFPHLTRLRLLLGRPPARPGAEATPGGFRAGGGPGGARVGDGHRGGAGWVGRVRKTLRVSENP
jgi:hypothetical protein